MRYVAQGVLAHTETEYVRRLCRTQHLLMAWCPDRLIFWEIKTSYWAQLQWWLKFSGGPLVRLRIPAFSSFRWRLDWKTPYSAKHLTHRHCPSDEHSHLLKGLWCLQGWEKRASLYFLGESRVSPGGSSHRQWSLNGGLRPGGITSVSAGTCPHTSTWGSSSESCTGWSLLSLTACLHGKTRFEPLPPTCASTSLCQVCSESPSPLPGKPFCEGFVGIPGQSSASFLSPVQKCFQGSSVASVHVFLGPLRISSCCVPLGQSPPRASLSNHASCSQNLNFCEIS